MLNKAEIVKLIAESQSHKCPKNVLHGLCVKIDAIANLPTRFGLFQIVNFKNNKDDKDHLAIIKGNILGKSNVLVRLHSECLTGDALGSLRCDCRDQLTTALEVIGKSPAGVLLYLRQEGRGIGLDNKVKAYALQDEGFDTFEANEKLGFADDEREYDIAAHMLYSLKIKSVKLMTNNPKKIKGLTDNGIKIAKRVSLVIPSNKYNRDYLQVKQDKGGHLLGNRHTKLEHEQNEKIVIKKKK